MGLFMDNQVEFFPTMYGTHAAGGIAVPFNARTRGLHLHHVVTKSDVSVIVVRDEYLEHLQNLDDIGVVETVVVVANPPKSRHSTGLRLWRSTSGSLTYLPNCQQIRLLERKRPYSVHFWDYRPR
ncbi:hypothetical protein CM1200mP19_2590 [bacterium]|nr:MAG: hypothetical protein CM1200mP19_2590 [bacterium]